MASTIIFLFLSSCTQQPNPQDLSTWNYTDLRYVDLDQTGNKSGVDIQAVYLRINHDINKSIQIRMDMDDIDGLANNYLYIAMDFKPGGTYNLPINICTQLEWDILIKSTTDKGISAIDAVMNPYKDSSVNIFRDSELETITITLTNPRFNFTQLDIGVQLIIVNNQDKRTHENTRPIYLTDAIPAKVPLLLAFWNVNPAYTPAQSIRNWSGAHAGPMGGRHGLFYLLQAADSYDMPVYLLDIATPNSLASLDYANKIEYLKKLIDKGIVILPYPQIPILNNQAIISSKAIHQKMIEFHTRTSQSYGISQKIIDLPYIDYSKIYNDGLYLNFITTYTNYIPVSFQPQPRANNIRLLGGNIANSSLGDPNIIDSMFAYIKHRNWIDTIDSEEIVTKYNLKKINRSNPVINHTTSPVNPNTYTDPRLKKIINQLGNTPMKNSYQAVWQLLFILNNTYDEEKLLYQQQYTPYLELLLDIAEWSLQPSNIYSCTVDINNIDYCILATNTQYIVFDQNDGYILFAFSIINSQLHQWVAPPFQLMKNTSSSSEPGYSIFSEYLPEIAPGAFYDGKEGLTNVLSDNNVKFYIGEKLYKEYILLDQSLLVQYHLKSPNTIHVPISLDPWTIFSPGWSNRYYLKYINGSYEIGIQDALRLRISTNVDLQYNNFLDSRYLTEFEENPDIEKPLGYHLPFPMIIFDFNGNTHTYMQISLSDY